MRSMRSMRVPLSGGTTALVLAAGAVAVTPPPPAVATSHPSDAPTASTARHPAGILRGQHRAGPSVPQALAVAVPARGSGQAPLQAGATGVTAPQAEMLDLINDERAQVHSGPLSFDGSLNAIAQQRSDDMITRHYFAHQIPGGGTVIDLLDRAGVPYQMAGENIALEHCGSPFQLLPALEQTNADFMASSGHRANILERNYSRIGIGLAVERKTDTLIVTEVFVQP